MWMRSVWTGSISKSDSVVKFVALRASHTAWLNGKYERKKSRKSESDDLTQRDPADLRNHLANQFNETATQMRRKPRLRISDAEHLNKLRRRT